MENKYEFFDKPITAPVADNKNMPSLRDELIIGKFTYQNNVRYISYDPISRHFFTHKYAAINEPELPKKPRNIEDGLEYGDIIISKENRIYRIVGVINEVNFLSEADSDYSIISIQSIKSLIKNGFKLKSEVEVKEEIQEMTVAEVSKALGKTIKIVE